jgi:hypothetical protein
LSQKWAEHQDIVKVSILVYGFALVCIQVYVFALVQIGGIGEIDHVNIYFLHYVYLLIGTIHATFGGQSDTHLLNIEV